MRKRKGYLELYTEDEHKIVVAANQRRTDLFFAFEKRNPKLARCPEQVYAVINHYIPCQLADEFYHRYAVADAKRRHRRYVPVEETLTKIDTEICHLLGIKSHIIPPALRSVEVLPPECPLEPSLGGLEFSQLVRVHM